MAGAYRRMCSRAHSPVFQMAILPTKKGPFGVPSAPKVLSKLVMREMSYCFA